MTVPRAAGIVLAGGESRRMGGPKALVEWDGVPLVAHVAGILAGAVSPVVVVRASGLRLPPLPAGAEVTDDAVADRGPLQGIAAGLRALASRADLAFVAAVDMPLLHPAFIREVVRAIGDADAAVPRAGGRAHPLAAAYRLGVLAVVERRLERGELGVTDMLADLRVRYLGEGDLARPESLGNANTPEELTRLRASAGRAP